MAEQDEQGKNEPATPFKREEARGRGFVAKSMEVNSFVILVSVIAVIVFAGDRMTQAQMQIGRVILDGAGRAGGDFSDVLTLVDGALVGTLKVIAPLLIVVLIAGVLSNILQTGPVFSFFPLKPDFDRVNPATGLKRIFSLRLIIETVKSLIKIVLFSLVAYFVIKSFLPTLISLMHIEAGAHTKIFLDMAAELGFKLAIVAMIIALFDLGYSQWDYAKNLMMSRHEIKEEIKRREGDPRIKARIKELQREMGKRSKSLSRVKDADVLITNPTHLAIALQYRRGEMVAPRVMAKGAGELAQKMNHMARLHRVPTFRNEKLARHLFKSVDIESEIPEAYYAEVAKILAWAYAAKGVQPGAPA